MNKNYIKSKHTPNTGNESKDLSIYLGGARGVMAIVIGNGHGDTSSNPGRE